MLRAGRMEDFVTEEEEPWYDQRDLEQGEASCVCRVSVYVCGGEIRWCNNALSTINVPWDKRVCAVGEAGG